MFDVVRPSGNERELAQEAKRLGYTELVFLYDAKEKPTVLADAPLPCKTACFVTTKDLPRIGVLRKHFQLTIGDGQERALFESNVDMLVGMERSMQKDHEHYRRSGLNQVLARLARKKILLFDASLFFTPRREIALGRVLQNATFARTFSVSCALCSFATTPIMMRDAKDVAAVSRLLRLPASPNLKLFK